MADDRFVKFTVAQARRIARVVRDSEKTLKSTRPELAQTADPRRHPNPHFAVRVFTDGGTPGTMSSTCSWTYRVTTMAGTHLGDGLKPDRRRFVNIPYTQTPDGTTGAGYFDEAGDFRLWDANELPELADC